MSYKRPKMGNLDAFALMEEITNYFIDQNNSGFVEGLNNKIKVIKRRCYGLTNIKRLFQRLWLDLEGYSLFLKNQ
jgi:transposase